MRSYKLNIVETVVNDKLKEDQLNIRLILFLVRPA